MRSLRILFYGRASQSTQYSRHVYKPCQVTHSLKVTPMLSYKPSQ